MAVDGGRGCYGLLPRGRETGDRDEESLLPSKASEEAGAAALDTSPARSVVPQPQDQGPEGEDGDGPKDVLPPPISSPVSTAAAIGIHGCDVVRSHIDDSRASATNPRIRREVAISKK